MTWVWILLGLGLYWWLGHHGCRFLKALSIRREWNPGGAWDGADELLLLVLWFFGGGFVWLWMLGYKRWRYINSSWFD